MNTGCLFEVRSSVKTSLTFERAFLGHNAAIYTLIGGLLPGQFISGGGEGWITQWSLDQNDGLLLAKAEAPVVSLEWIDKGHQLAAGTLDGKLHFIDLTDQKNTRVFDLTGKASVFSILKSNSMIWVADGIGRLTRWDSQGELKGIFQLSGKPLRKIAALSEGKILISGSEGKIFEFDIKGEEVTREWLAHDPSVFAIHFINDQKRLWSGGRDALLKRWDISSELPVCEKEVNAHWFTVNDIAFHPSQRIFATASRDKRLRLWDNEARLLQSIDPGTPNGHINSVNTLLWSASGEYLVSAGDDRSIRSWKLTEKSL